MRKLLAVFSLTLLLGSCVSVKEYQKSRLTTLKWNWQTEKWRNLKPIFISIAKVQQVPMAAKVVEDVAVIEPF